MTSITTITGSPSPRSSGLSATLTRLVVLGCCALLPTLGSTQQAESRSQELSEREVQERRDEALRAAINALEPRYRQWVVNVLGFISQGELEYFLSLREDFRRDAFMEVFWEPRDPDPITPTNELRTRWQEYIDATGGAAPSADPRFQVLLVNGPPGRWSLPNGQVVDRCYSKTRELEIWFYRGSEATPRSFAVIFFKRRIDTPYEIWRPGRQIDPVGRQGGLPTTDILQLCADDLLRYAVEDSGFADYGTLLEQITKPRMPSAEWIASVIADTTDVPPGARTFDLVYRIQHPDRNQSRTALQVLIDVPTAVAPGRDFSGDFFHNFQVKGEIVRDNRLFESFSYRFEGPTDLTQEHTRIGFTRYLRPGRAELLVRVEDEFGGQYAHIQHSLDIPSPEGLAQIDLADRLAAAGITAAGASAPGSRPEISLRSPAGALQVGLTRFHTQAQGDFDKVTFFLDDQPVVSKRTPPYSVEIDLGENPAPHRVRVVAYQQGEEAATDQIWLNQGAQRFRVRLIEPRAGGIYPGSLTARAEVTTPDGSAPERLELWVNDERQAVLEGGAQQHTLNLPGSQVAVVRAVAYLADGSTSEDAVIVNASGFTENVEVQLVEVQALVIDAQGRPITGLEKGRFRVLEDGRPQVIDRFLETNDAPLTAALLIDRSASMEDHLGSAAGAAMTFARGTLQSTEDRVALLSFAGETSVEVGFSNDLASIERALAGLDAEGRTALWDSVAQALNYFEGTRGQTALLVFTDGRDEVSRLERQQVVEAARRVGVTLYAVGMLSAFDSRDARRDLEDLASETGGRALFVESFDELEPTFAAIQVELRKRYLIAYQPTTAGSGSFRTISVEVDQRGAQVRARSGYYP